MPEITAQDVARVEATFRLATTGRRHPELKRLEADARLDLAAAIMKFDDADATDEARAGSRHTLHEQAAVERAVTAYRDALANLVRGDDSKMVVDRWRDRDPEHIREDLNTALDVALASVLGDALTAKDRAKADAIVAATHGYNESEWCLTETLAQFGPKVFGAVLLHNLEAKNTLMGQSASLTRSRSSLAALGLTLEDLGWPNETPNAQYQS